MGICGKATWLGVLGVFLLVLLPVVSELNTSHASSYPAYLVERFGYPPEVPEGEVSPDLSAAVRVALIEGVTSTEWGDAQERGLEIIASSGDPRLGWILSDAARFAWDRQRYEGITDAASRLLGVDLKELDRWSELTNRLMAWDLPAYPGYLADKRSIYTHFGDDWTPLFVDGEVDWRFVSWGGVGMDQRAYGDTETLCRDCIPAADDPIVESAAEALWLEDDDIVFGVSVNGEHRAYPRRIMEVRELVNDTLGGRDLAIPYCTLCGAAQAYFTDQMPEGVQRPILRTSGLLIRSNKVMFDIITYSVFDTFLGRGVTGPLRGLKLSPVTVVTTEWGKWKKAHPETTVLVEELALGRDYDLRNSRDADGPIFPIGDVDPRMAAQEDVLGVLSPDGQPIAFQRSTAVAALSAGHAVELDNVRLELEAGGLRATTLEGQPLGSHQAFWFAWSQFYPDTRVWTRVEALKD